MECDVVADFLEKPALDSNGLNGQQEVPIELEPLLGAERMPRAIPSEQGQRLGPRLQVGGEIREIESVEMSRKIRPGERGVERPRKAVSVELSIQLPEEPIASGHRRVLQRGNEMRHRSDEVAITGVERPALYVEVEPFAAAEQVQKSDLPPIFPVRPPLQLDQSIKLVMNDVPIGGIARQDEHWSKLWPQMRERLFQCAEVAPEVDERLVCVFADELPNLGIVVDERDDDAVLVDTSLRRERKRPSRPRQLGLEVSAKVVPALRGHLAARLGCQLDDGIAPPVSKRKWGHSANPHS